VEIPPKRPGQRRLLALDGGGIRGVITVEILAEIEEFLQQRDRKPGLVLADYFDYIAGTSTGAIVAAGLALGMPVDQIRKFYLRDGPTLFSPVPWWNLPKRFRTKYEAKQLSAKLQRVYGPTTTLGSPWLKTLLMVVLRNETTDSPWPLSTNPNALFNDPNEPGNNLDLPLWQVVRASTAAPTFFPAEEVSVGSERFIFVDGGVTPFNNPAWMLFTMATAEPYNLKWTPDKDSMLLVSVGTGSAASEKRGLRRERMNLLYNALSVPGALMNAAAVQQDLLCRTFGDCRFGAALDLELGSLTAGDARGNGGPVPDKVFTYLRYEPALTDEGLWDLGLASIDPKEVLPMDNVSGIESMRKVGEAYARKSFDSKHFNGF